MVCMQDEMLAPNGNGSRGVLSALLYLFFPTFSPPLSFLLAPPAQTFFLLSFVHSLSFSLLSSMFSFLTPESSRFAI